ncbi:hypothetical protein [Bacillus wiedmannii]|uniref:hypothetical protein n=1 Tax=Bacillus wiedmannii TaxID=1890302 RepID=UPI000BF65951|nr:hypothetical protein [Bacillus wiedmannii]PGA30261.1 hypothetical protein COL74_25945 [Bacillus wiedmannii]PGE57627.1 hypothetical protein COM65_22690 [Bacillus wiedmannii]PHB56418.1 hypothetical protein COE92_09250 [Bacillus wiedmannii]PHC02035.1 hypothetical protein COE96_03470 [Bacillus wiedmannii]
MKKYITTVSVWLITIFLFIFNFVAPPSTSWVNFWTNGTIILGWILFAIQTTYTNSNMFYLFVQRRLFSLFSGKECYWSMRIYMLSNISMSELNIFDEKLRKLYSPDELRIIEISDTRRDYKIESLRFEVTYDEDKKQFVFDIQDMEITYKTSIEIFEDKLDIIVNELKKVVQPYNDRYSVRVKLKKNNPYMGLFLKRINPENINSFNVKFHNKESQISIYKQHIEINSGSYDQLKISAKSYLAFSPK